MKEYYISFHYTKGASSGFGGGTMFIDAIDNAKAIDKITVSIKDHYGYDAVVILNWKVL